MVRQARVVFRRTPVMVVATEVASIAQTAAPPSGRGRYRRDVSTAAAGQVVIISDNLAELQYLKLGELLSSPRPSGRSGSLL